MFRMTDEPRPQNHPSAGHRDRCPFTMECGSRNHPLVRRQIFTRREYHRDKRVYNETSQNNPSPITTVTIGLQLWVTLLLPWIPVMPRKAKNNLKTPLTISKPKKSPSAHHVEPVGGAGGDAKKHPACVQDCRGVEEVRGSCNAH